eukprot:CAMPEP_0179279720 /NCGR_PEP_ID=MMETSP0797-20121207/36260_1 /TAXON_ID=47934 /ORGANISM="Dinophysis acuminata, Strain DAEP01" /LENGTH=82 /DNA_ID=CAMNT_0020988359 /DNA_START=78 /DNA_END=322 /DNA_ORIENTATION=-
MTTERARGGGTTAGLPAASGFRRATLEALGPPGEVVGAAVAAGPVPAPVPAGAPARASTLTVVVAVAVAAVAVAAVAAPASV